MKTSTKTPFFALSLKSALTLAMIFVLNTLSFAQPLAPTLITPADTSTYQPHSLGFMWSISTTATLYHVQVSTNANFNTLAVNDSTITDSSLFVNELLFKTKYYWRVRAMNGALKSPFTTAFTFTTWDSIPKGPHAVNLGLTKNFAILAYSAVTNVPASAIKGDVGLTPTSGSFIGLSEGEVTGTMFTVDASGPAGSIASAVMLTQAKGDLTIAYNDAAGRTVNPIGIAGNLGGQTIYPGLYKSTGTLEISAGDLTLDAGGHTDAVWIFQIASSFNMTSSRQVFLVNGANAANIFWQVGSAATFGTTSVMKGTIMAGTQVTFATGATLDGRALALTENVTLQQNVINVPVDSTFTSTEELNTLAPVSIRLSQNYPNPFNPSTTIQFGITETSNVKLEVFTMLGQRVALLVNEMKTAGMHTISFDASALASGMYLYRVSTNGAQLTKHMTLIK